MILIGLGANLPGARHSTARDGCEAALAALVAAGVRIARRSPWYESAPVPASDQPWFVNGVAALETRLGPVELLGLLHRIEANLGRLRRQRNAPRVIDIDLLAYRGLVRVGPAPPILPHPRMTARAFVLLPLRDLAPDWRHPGSGRALAALIADLPPGQCARRLMDGTPAERP